MLEDSRLQLHFLLCRQGSGDGDGGREDGNRSALITLTESDLKDPTKVEEDNTCLVPSAEEEFWAPNDTTTLFRYVVCDSYLYQLGGAIDKEDDDIMPIDDIFCISLESSRRSCGWMRGPSMVAKRVLPGVVLVDGMIYVLGGIDDNSGYCPWAEVYDPRSMQWNSLEGPPSINNWDSRGDPCCYIDHSRSSSSSVKKILVYNRCSKRLLAYDLNLGQWDEGFGKKHKLDNIPCTVTHLLPSGRTLFLTSPEKWWVFDLGSMKHRGAVNGIKRITHELLEFPMTCMNLKEIISLGGSRDIDGKSSSHHFVLFFWISNDFWYRPPYYVVKIKVVEDKVENNFSASLVSVGRFRLDKRFSVDHFYATITPANMSSSSSSETEDGDNGGRFADHDIVGLGEEAATSFESEVDANNNPKGMPADIEEEEEEEEDCWGAWDEHIRVQPKLLNKAPAPEIVEDIKSDDNSVRLVDEAVKEEGDVLLYEAKEGDKGIVTSKGEVVVVSHDGEKVLKLTPHGVVVLNSSAPGVIKGLPQHNLSENEKKKKKKNNAENEKKKKNNAHWTEAGSRLVVTGLALIFFVHSCRGTTGL